ncbi:MAG: hypothetical protein WDO73_22130 [Ignavibacteriota bacterium]
MPSTPAAAATNGNGELNDPLPEFFIRSWHLRGLKDATPRFNFEGPIVAGKLFLSEGIDYEVRKTEVYELPFPYNQKKQEGVNSFSQLDWIVSDKHLVTLTAHIAPQKMDFVNLDYFNPEPTTPDSRTRNYTGVLSDHLTLFGGLLDTNFSVTKFDANIWGQGSGPLDIAPGGNTGSYFATQDREALRIGGTTTYSMTPWHRWGVHNFKFGADVAGSNEDGQVQKRPVNLFNAQSQLLENILFTPGLPFEISDVGMSFFAQDHWQLNDRLSFDIGLRSESQEITDSFRLAPPLRRFVERVAFRRHHHQRRVRMVLRPGAAQHLRLRRLPLRIDYAVRPPRPARSPAVPTSLRTRSAKSTAAGS